MIHALLQTLLLIYVGLSRQNTRFLKITEITPWIFWHGCKGKARNIFRTTLVRLGQLGTTRGRDLEAQSVVFKKFWVV